MAGNEELLKAFFFIKKRKDGKLNCYFSKNGNYNSEAILSENGFRDWHHVETGFPQHLPGFVGVQIRPWGNAEFREDGSTYFLAVDYEQKFKDWKFTLRHHPRPFQYPDWLHIGAIKKACMELMPEWGKHHLVKNRLVYCKPGKAIAALNGSKIIQEGGSAWGYKNSNVIQGKNCVCETFLHDFSTGTFYTIGRVHDHAKVEVYPSGQVEAFGNSRIILHPGQKGELGKFTCFGNSVKVFIKKPDSLEPVKYEPQLESRPYYPRTGLTIHAPFNLPVE